MSRSIRPIGPVTPALKRHGYRQQAAIIVDGKQLEHTIIFSKKVDGKTKFEGHYIDTNGELHKTTPFVDMKRAASRILIIRERVMSEIATVRPAVKAPAKRAAKKSPAKRAAPATVHSIGSSALIDCVSCGMLHRDDVKCFIKSKE